MYRLARSTFASLTGPLVGLFAFLLLASVPQTSRAQEGPSDTTRVSFDEAVRIALDQNTNIKRAQSSARQAGTTVQTEWMDFAPNLSFSSGASRFVGRNFNEIEGEVVTQSTDQFSVSTSSSLTLFNGFENVASLRQAQDQAHSSELGLQRTRREVVSTVMDQFIALVQNREIIRVREEQVQAQRQSLRQIREFVQAGSRPTSDLYTAQADLADAEQQLLAARRDLEVSKTQLIQTLQLNPRDAYDFQVPDLQSDSLGAATYDLSTLIDEAFQNRLDLQAARAEKRAAEHGIRVARSSYYPSVSISGGYGTDWSSRARPVPGEQGSPGLIDQFDRNRSGSVRLSLSFPIFQRFQRSAQVEQAQVQAQNAQYALQDQRQTVALQVRQAYLDYRNARQQLQAATKRLRAAEQARTAARERYNLGSADIVELQNAIRDYVEAASQQVRARYNLIYQQERIQYTVGRLDPAQPLFTPQSSE